MAGVDYDLKALRKGFRQIYVNIIKRIHTIRQNDINKKVVSVARDLRDICADYLYDESINLAVAKRKFLMNRLVVEEDISDVEDDRDTNTDTD